MPHIQDVIETARINDGRTHYAVTQDPEIWRTQWVDGYLPKPKAFSLTPFEIVFLIFGTWFAVFAAVLTAIVT